MTDAGDQQQQTPDQWSNRRILFLAVVIALIFYAVFRLPTTINYLLARARDTVILLILSVALTYFLLPTVNMLTRVPARLDRQAKRAWAAGLSLVIFLGLIVLLGTVVVTPIVEETGKTLETVTTWAQEDLAGQVEGYVNGLLARLPESYREQVEEQIAAAERQWTVERITETISKRVQTWGKALLEWQVNFIATVLSSGRYIIALLIVPVFTYYFLTDATAIREGVVSHIPRDARKRYHQMLDDIDRVIQGYVRMVMVISLATGVATALTLYFAGVDVFLTFGILAGIANMVPVLGGIVAVIGITAISLLQVGLKTTIVVMIVYGGIQFVTDRVIAPRLMAEGAQLHPIAVLLGVLVGAEFFGMIGVFVAVPVLAAARVAWIHYRAYMSEGDHSREWDSLLGRREDADNPHAAEEEAGGGDEEPASVVEDNTDDGEDVDAQNGGDGDE